MPCSVGKSFQQASSLMFPRIQELHALRDDSELAAFLAGLFIVPCFELQPAIDVRGRAFPEILRHVLSELAATRRVDERDRFLFLFAAAVNFVDGESDFANRGAAVRGSGEQKKESVTKFTA